MLTQITSLFILLLLASSYSCLEVERSSVSFRQEEFLQFAQQYPQEAFEQWAQKYNKEYIQNNHKSNGLFMNNMVQNRYDIWKDNLQYVLSKNSVPNKKYTLGMNKLADLSPDEYKKRLGYNYKTKKGGLLKDKINNKKEGFIYEDILEKDLPESIDWREKNAVTKVKDQGGCGSCWAFSTTGSIEGINAIYTGNLTTLSEQELVDCDVEVDQGCNGGLMDYAFEFVIENGGIDTEKDYPYDGFQEHCVLGKERKTVVSIDSYQDVPASSEKDLLKAAANQPISVALDGADRDFQLYMEGIFTGSCGEELNHGVLVVGYGKSRGTKYWIVKNSWGPTWGEDGFIKLERDVGSNGLCGIAMEPSFPIKKSDNPAPVPDTPTPDAPAPAPSGSNECNELFSCEPGQTCCCTEEFLGFCFNYGCCEYDQAVCCKDKVHCCPSAYPVCQTSSGSCATKNSDGSVDKDDTVKMKKKAQAKFNFGWHLGWTT